MVIHVPGSSQQLLLTLQDPQDIPRTVAVMAQL